jgi:hypothetical protein
MPISDWLRRNLPYVLIGVFLAPVLAHLYASQFTRLLADDYCYGGEALTRGWWGALDYYFNNWQGQFSTVGLLQGVVLLGVNTVRWLPAAYLVLWSAAWVWAIYQFNRLTGMRQPFLAACLMTALVMYAIVAGAPNIYQSLYWASASVTYITPMVMLTTFIGILLYVQRRPIGGIGLAVIAGFSLLMMFIADGFSTTFSALQCTLLALGLLVYFSGKVPQRRAALVILLAGFIGAVTALIPLVGAPGNAIRQARFPPPLPLPTVALENLKFAGAFLAMDAVLFSAIPLVVALMCAGVLYHHWQPLSPMVLGFIKRHSRWLLAASFVVWLLLTYALLIPSTYSVATMPPGRTLIIPHTLLIILAVAWGAIMGLGMQKTTSHDGLFLSSRWALIALVPLLLVGPLRTTVETLALTGEFRKFAQEWDARDHTIRVAVAAGETELVVPPFTEDLAELVYVASAGEQSNQGMNACVELYYGLESFSVRASD